jgi:hypothetical protein
MRPLQRLLSTSVLFIAGSGAILWGCWPLDFVSDCEFLDTCPVPLTGSSGSGGNGGSGGGTPDECIPSKNTNAVDDSCGVFASSSLGDDTTGDGTKDKPYRTLEKALMEANTNPVYACSETFAEAIVLSGGTELYGGLDCTMNWSYSGDVARTTIAPLADQIPLTLSSGSDTTRIENIAAQGADATISGGSSIAAIIDGATAAITRCDFMAGAGAKGDDGESFPADPALNGAPGNAGANACMGGPVSGNPGGMSATKACDSSEMTVGGKGGDGGKIDAGPPIQALAGADGEDGQPVGTGGAKGVGEPATGAWGCSTGGGQAGDPGAPGAPGAGASGLGMLSPTGYSSIEGSAGMPGTPGQGGGGGGGAKGGTNICAGGLEGAGASGGSGGSGGCGGRGGGGGKGGGASIAVISLNANLTLTDCTLTAGPGGNGGTGGDRQPGGSGGTAGLGGMGSAAGSGSNAACAGGNGGNGGQGGPGGGGLGGHSIGIAYTGTLPIQEDVTIAQGTEGTGGLGGNMNTASNHGADGTAVDVQQFVP